MADLKTNKITRLYDFEPKKTAKSGEINNEFNQFVNSVSDVVDDLTAVNDETVGNTNNLIQVTADTATAVITANAADAKADTAIITADGAATLAATADGKADTAVTTANAADSKADTAITTANQAVIDAEAAQAAAEQAAIDAAAAEAAVALKADVAYVDSVANDFQLGEVMPNSILRTQLNSVVTDELDVLRTDVNTAQGTADTNTTGIANVITDIGPLVPSDVTLQAITVAIASGVKKVTLQIDTTITGGAITINTKPLVNVDLTPVVELSADTKYFEVIEGAVNFTLRPSGAGEVAWLQQYTGANAELLDSKGKAVDVKAGEYVYNEFYSTKLIGDGSILFPNPIYNTWADGENSSGATLQNGCTVGDYIYFKNGSIGRNYIKYHPLTDTWDLTLPLEPSGQAILWPVAVGTKIYCQISNLAKNYRVFDTVTDTWIADTVAIPLVEAEEPVVIGTDIFALDDAGYKYIKYDTLLDTWDETLATVGIRIRYACSIGTKIYVTEYTDASKIRVYDTLLNTWSLEPDLIYPIGYIVNYNGIIYGRHAVSPYETIKYDPVLQEVTLLEGTDNAWSYPAVYGEGIYARAATDTTIVTKFDLQEQVDFQIIPPTTKATKIIESVCTLWADPVVNPDYDTWYGGIPLEAIDAHAVILADDINDKVFVKLVRAFKIYDIETNTWTTGASSVNNWTYATIDTVNQKIYCIGGASPYKMYVYDIQLNTWDETTGGDFNAIGSPLSASKRVFNNKVFTSKYGTPSKQIYAYDIDTKIWDASLAVGSVDFELTNNYAMPIDSDGILYIKGLGDSSIVLRYDIPNNVWLSAIDLIDVYAYFDIYNGFIYYINTSGILKRYNLTTTAVETLTSSGFGGFELTECNGKLFIQNDVNNTMYYYDAVDIINECLLWEDQVTSHDLKALVAGSLEMATPVVDQVYQGFKSKEDLFDVGMEGQTLSKFWNKTTTIYNTLGISSSGSTLKKSVNGAGFLKSFSSNLGSAMLIRIKADGVWIIGTSTQDLQIGAYAENVFNIKFETSLEIYTTNDTFSISYSLGDKFEESTSFLYTPALPSTATLRKTVVGSGWINGIVQLGGRLGIIIDGQSMVEGSGVGEGKTIKIGQTILARYEQGFSVYSSLGVLILNTTD